MIALMLVASAAAASAALVAWAARARGSRQVDTDEGVFDEAAAD